MPLISPAGKLNWVSVTDYGASGTGDCTTAINAALATGQPVYFPPGNYFTQGQHNINANGQVVFGAGPANTTITCTVNNEPIFTSGTLAGLNNIGVTDMTLTRNVTAISNGDGVQFANAVSMSYLERLTINSQFRGLLLGPTDLSRACDINITGCQDSGVLMTNSGSNGTLQWELMNILSQENVGNGFFVNVTAGPSQATLGNWTNVTTFANSGHGASFTGLLSCPIDDIRICDSFFGSDGNHAINIQNSYGGQHIILDTFMELAGQMPTGPGLATAASGVGSGIFVDATVNDILISGCKINDCSNSGVNINATEANIVNCRITQNGSGGHVGDRNAIWLQAGRAVVSGCRLGNVTGGANNTVNGIRMSVDNATIVGNDLTGNTGATITYDGGALVNSVVIGNIPASSPTQVDNLGLTGFLTESEAVLAAAGTTQGTAAAITTQTVVVTVSSGAANGVILPVVGVGTPINVWNRGSVTLNVYPQSGQTIEALGANNPAQIAVGGKAEFISTTAQWYRN